MAASAMRLQCWRHVSLGSGGVSADTRCTIIAQLIVRQLVCLCCGCSLNGTKESKQHLVMNFVRFAGESQIRSIGIVPHCINIKQPWDASPFAGCCCLTLRLSWYDIAQPASMHVPRTGKNHAAKMRSCEPEPLPFELESSSSKCDVSKSGPSQRRRTVTKQCRSMHNSVVVTSLHASSLGQAIACTDNTRSKHNVPDLFDGGGGCCFAVTAGGGLSV